MEERKTKTKTNKKIEKSNNTQQYILVYNIYINAIYNTTRSRFFLKKSEKTKQTNTKKREIIEKTQ